MLTHSLPVLSANHELHLFREQVADFCAVICLVKHNRGVALGGCRMLDYPSLNAAMQDVLRLAKAMSYKAAISELWHDGGKAVIMRPRKNSSHTKVLRRFAACVDSLQGKYITTIDSGTTQADMLVIKNYTPHVTGFLVRDCVENDPAVFTALGVGHGLQAAAQLTYGRDCLEGLHVAIQGVGKVGYQLAKWLAKAGARLTVCDPDPTCAARCAREFNAAVVAPEMIYAVQCDVFSPCALGQVINPITISILQAKIIAGAANEQLASIEMAEQLHQRGILYVPDFVINAGGLIYLSWQRAGKDKFFIEQEVARIRQRIMSLAANAKLQQITLLNAAQTAVAATLARNK